MLRSLEASFYHYEPLLDRGLKRFTSRHNFEEALISMEQTDTSRPLPKRMHWASTPTNHALFHSGHIWMETVPEARRGSTGWAIFPAQMEPTCSHN